MNGDAERYHLSMDEIIAIMSMSGKETLFGFSSEASQPLSQERFWNACVGLVADGFMTQIDGKYRLRRDLFDILLPVYEAKTVLILTPGSDRYSQVAYYLAERITAVEPAAFGGFSLWAMDAAELPESIRNHVPLRFWVEALPVPEREPEAGEGLESVLLERIDAGTGLCMGRLRCVERGMESWLETADGCKPLTQERLCLGVEALLKGEY